MNTCKKHIITAAAIAFLIILAWFEPPIANTITKPTKGGNMLILKHVEYEIKDIKQLESLLAHLQETTSQVEGVVLKDIYFYFVKDKKEFVLFLECESEAKYLRWRKICPPPAGAKDWHEVLLNREAYFSK